MNKDRHPEDDTPPPAPARIGNWARMGVDSLYGLWSDVGNISVTYGGEKREWKIGRSEVDLTIFLITDLPHPDYTGRGSKHASYSLDVSEMITDAAEKLLKGAEP